MPDNRETAYEHMRSRLESARSTDPDEAMTGDSALDFEVRDRYVFALLSTGGPHEEVLFEFSTAEEATYWFECMPQGALFTYMDWGTRDDIYISPDDAALLLTALARSSDDLDDEDEDDVEGEG